MVTPFPPRFSLSSPLLYLTMPRSPAGTSRPSVSGDGLVRARLISRATRVASLSIRDCASACTARSRTMPSGTPNSTRIATTIVSVDARSRRRTSSRFEAEPDAAHGRDQTRIGRVVTELLAQRRDVHVEGPGRAEVVLVPDLLHQPLTRDHTAGVEDQQREHVEFLR